MLWGRGSNSNSARVEDKNSCKKPPKNKQTRQRYADLKTPVIGKL